MGSQAKKVKNPVKGGSATFTIVLVSLIAVIAAIIAGAVIYQNKFSVGWKISDVKAPDNLQVKTVAEGNGQGQYINFYTKEDVDSIVSVFSDPQCPVCREFEKENGEDLDTLVEKGEVALRFHMMSFLDDNHGGHYSNLVSKTMGIIANEDSAKVAWTFYHSIWDNRKDSSLDVQGMSEIVEKMGAKPETVSKVKDIDLESEDHVNTSNIEALEQAVGNVGTPTVFINGVEQPDAVSSGFFQEILDDGTPEESKVSDGVHARNLLKISVPESQNENKK